MSNTQVGGVYQQIILDVVESSRVDFEEGGVDENVLEQLRQGWQSKLSQLGVATFPWDPKPEPQPIANPPTVPSNAGNYQPRGSPPLALPQSNMQQVQQQVNNMNGMNGMNGNMNGGNPRIKTEPGLENPMMGNQAHQQSAQYGPPLNLPHNATTAQQRAAQHMHQSFGARATASINAIQGTQGQAQHQQNAQTGQQGPTAQQFQQMQQAQMMHQQQQQRGAQGQSQGQGAPQGQNMQQNHNRPNITQEQYNRLMAQKLASQQAAAQQASSQQQRLQQLKSVGANGQNGVGSAQTDGAGDDFVIAQTGPNGQQIMGRIEIDNLLREKIESMGRRMEGGGLMLPLHQASTPADRRQKRAKTASQGPGQVDGDDDEDSPTKEEADEDAINSDLDDPEEGEGAEDDDEDGLGHIMLCMYDKVQRVKNKWKCVMKDGVLTINGKEYVFHKATGEYEW